MKSAFSLLELIIVVAIIGILASIAVPKLYTSRADATLLRLKADFTTINSAISAAKSEIFVKNATTSLFVLDEATPNADGEPLFYCSNEQILACKSDTCCTAKILDRAIFASNTGWVKTGQNKYRFHLSSKKSVDFEFKDGHLECLNSTLCKEL